MKKYYMLICLIFQLNFLEAQTLIKNDPSFLVEMKNYIVDDFGSREEQYECKLFSSYKDLNKRYSCLLDNEYAGSIIKDWCSNSYDNCNCIHIF